MSSSYDSAVVDTAMIEDPRLLNLPRGIRLLFLEMLVWAKLRRTDGHVPLGAIPRLTDEPEPLDAAGRLEKVGLLRTDEEIGGYWIVDFTRTQMDRATVERKVRNAKEARERYEERHPARRRRDASDVSGDSSGDVSGDATASLPARQQGKGRQDARPPLARAPGARGVRGRSTELGRVFSRLVGHPLPNVENARIMAAAGGSELLARRILADAHGMYKGPKAIIANTVRMLEEHRARTAGGAGTP